MRGQRGNHPGDRVGAKSPELTSPLILSLSKDAPERELSDKQRWFDKLTMSGFCSWRRLYTYPEPANPSNRRSGESRNPGNPTGKECHYY